ncbi:ABC transporter ATP-binding protein [Microbispora bryophytorum]|uniref:ABC-type quaternary amine transporter n=1 Tax=Microbispora bryophytorum TaxID=1460882 RepID=A0A8H9LFE6_9ACTN|nr:ATP-binding cassette domain-containing protein [Microbispora bryophytorum]MBD3138114.1 ATP-binding cassette domain-containing protein [Microbispora bryophytorum]TQS05317.1 ATP-binding cassette domain-containing protein [Microbispora bryophytorum]GGO21697.1 proline/glycine betaine ABC transporter ATP-binding protein [Microbispora bryophytorum]
MITFEDVTKRYRDGTVAVDGLSLEASTGAITVFVGPSGCGKTTSLRMINRMIDATSGRITLDGQDVREIDPPTLRRGIGYVIQQAGLFPHRKIVDNVATVPYLLGWSKKKARSRAMELLELVGLDPALAGRFPFQLSGGQQQRVGVARALAADPPVLLMDEPFSAVDPIVRASLQDELLRLQLELRKTIVFVTHDIDEAVKLGDTVAVMRVGGRLAQMAGPATLLTEPADDFVREFLGRDRGIRRLSFISAKEMRLSPSPSDLVIDEDGRALGWRTADGLAAYGTFNPETDSLRVALDAALLSPNGTAVAVDEEGRVRGVAGRDSIDKLLGEYAPPATGPAPGGSGGGSSSGAGDSEGAPA